MFWKRTLHKYVAILIYMNVKSSLPKNTIFELGTDTASSCSGMALNAFWKRALPMSILPDQALSITRIGTELVISISY